MFVWAQIWIQKDLPPETHKTNTSIAVAYDVADCTVRQKKTPNMRTFQVVSTAQTYQIHFWIVTHQLRTTNVQDIIS